LTNAAITEVLDAVGWPAGDRDLEIGKTTMQRWWTGVDVMALGALRDIEETERGFVRESADGKIRFEDRHWRLTGARLTSQATYSDVLGAALPIIKIQQLDPIEDLYSIFTANVARQTVNALAVLWTLGETGQSSPSINASETRIWIAEHPLPDTATEVFGVDAWTTPVENTDYEANSQADGGGVDHSADLTIAVVKGLNRMEISITNNAAVVVFITLLQARGTALAAQAPTGVYKEIAASITKYGEREYPGPAKFLSTTDEAANYVEFLSSIYSSPIPVLSLQLDANVSAAMLTEAKTRDVSDRVTITSDLGSDLGINEDFWVERIVHRINRFRQHTFQVDVSTIRGFSGYWVLGTSLLGVGSKLFF
jgi:hypothetical protein